MASTEKTESRPDSGQTLAAPSISLPKGGGAIRGMGEKFAANPVTGTGSMTVPIATSPGRSGFGPQLALSYDSGAGNGPFGFGWSLSLPSITRKTDKGLPQYRDAEDSDVFVLSGAEDLVPVYRQDPDGTWVAGRPGFQRDPDGFWVRDPSGRRVVHEDDLDGYRVRRYRPRIEGLFSRIERWTNLGTPGDVHWRSISKDNVLTLYGHVDDDGSHAAPRIADPLDASRVFSWLICETRDDKGNAVVYRYKAEDGAGVVLDRAHERNRGPQNEPRRTANRYLERILYGNRTPLLGDAGDRPRLLTQAKLDGAGWMFEVVLDYGEHDLAAPEPNDAGAWGYRPDPFSTYRSGFEVRTTRLCQRVLMFHHFPDEAGVRSDCLVRSTDFTYSHEMDATDLRNPVYAFLRKVTQTGYRRNDGGYDSRSLPPVELGYTEPVVQDTVEEVDPQSLENLPIGLDGTAYRWTDLHGEGIPGILTEQAGAWFYKRNVSPIPTRLPDGREQVKAQFAPLETVALKPNLALAGGAELMDLAGDGLPDLVVLGGPSPGLYEHDGEEGWQPFRPFTSRLNRDLGDPNLKFIDLDGDGHADVLITEDDTFVWHPSLEEEGFGPARRVARSFDEEKGPRIVFADGTQSIHLADLGGDGLTDIVRIRNGEVCYWPNLGYGRFGAKVTMDDAPLFDHPDQFDPKRIRLADIDGSGTTDVIYLHRNGVRLYFNQSGNSWSTPHLLKIFPRVDDVVSIVPTDLLGDGTACLVWSSPLVGDGRRQMRYVNLMGRRKPHLLVKTINNLGAETRVDYAPSTKFYLQDKRDGRPWITRLPFPVHVVERVETYDHVSRNRFVTRYAYHHGYFDGEEREFRGFGMVEQWDTEQLAALADGEAPADNIAAASHVPPVHTKTWFHTGISLGRERVSRHFEGEYFRELGLTIETARPLLLDDTIVPPDLTLEEEREACRALKGSMLRQEVYADDAEHPGATPDQVKRARTPYTVTEQNFTVRPVQPRADNRHAVFFTHPREAISYHYERNPADPRIQHALTLEVDEHGNVLKEAAVGYGCRVSPLSTQWDRDRQTTPLLTYTENRVTNAIESADTQRNPLPCEAVTFELTGYTPTGAAGRYRASDLVEPDPAAPGRLCHKLTDQVAYEAAASGNPCRRPIEWLRTLYRRDDLSGLMPLGEVQPLALPGEDYKLAFTPGLLAQVFQQAGQPLLPEPADVLGGQGADRGGYVLSQDVKAAGHFPASDLDDHWWIPAGRVFLSPGSDDSAAQELAFARAHFFLPHRTRDPFHTDALSTESFVTYDRHDLLMLETRDALDNRVTVDANDYRVLQPRLVSDPNRNQTEFAFDILGMVVATAVMGKPRPPPMEGDTLSGFVADLTQAEIDDFFDAAGDPHAHAPALLQSATTRIVYDLDRFLHTRKANPNDPTAWQPACAATLARETHASDPLPPQGLKIQLSFSYSDGFGREIQKKIQAEPEKVNGVAGPPRWVGSGWTIFNNKGKPVRQYEPFFSPTHRFEFAAIHGVSPVLFYDPAERVIATLHPNHTYEKVVFDPWRQTTYDVNDTCAPRNQQTGDPRTDLDIGGYVRAYFTQQQDWKTWLEQRVPDPLNPPVDTGGKQPEQDAAIRAMAHADTPATAHFDALGRPFLTVARNRVVCAHHDLDGTEDSFATRVELDIEGNQRAVHDERKLPVDHLPTGAIEQRVVMRYDYDMLGNRIHQLSMEAGERWTLNDVAGNPIRAWDSRGHLFRTEYDPLRRPLRSFVIGGDLDDPVRELLTERLVYGEQHPDAEHRSLRGVPYLHLDQAGAVTTERLDFKGNPLRASRRIATKYKQAIDWSAVDAALPINASDDLDPVALEAALAPLLESAPYESSTTYDALNRPVTLTSPHTPAMLPNVVRPGYNEAGLLERVDANLRAEVDADGKLIFTPFVTSIDYDAKGQRQHIEYGNDVGTRYEHDPLTFQLTRLTTRRGTEALQDLGYTYDPAGNITHIRDDAQQTIYFKNQRVEPSAEYTYDALYRLIEATGREHLGQLGRKPIPHSHDDAKRVGFKSGDVAGQFGPNDDNAMGTYIERYVYDAVGNFLQMRHHGSDPSHEGWTRRYAYDEKSLIEDGTEESLLRMSNRLSSTTVGQATGQATETYSTAADGYDPHGSMLRMPHLSLMQWDYRDQLQATARRVDNNGGTPETTWYVYDAAGERVRKLTESANGKLQQERIYLGGFEIFRDNNIDGSEKLVRETLHILDDSQRIALVETRTDTPTPEQLVRYQLGNHLGSASLELDREAKIITYEEYTPYGSTAYQAGRSQAEVKRKQYRYTGMERDEESGFSYHSARYYLPWLGRWGSADPAGLADGGDLYRYSRNTPIAMLDELGTQPKPGIGTRGNPYLIESLDDLPIDESTRTGALKGYRFWIKIGKQKEKYYRLDKRDVKLRNNNKGDDAGRIQPSPKPEEDDALDIATDILGMIEDPAYLATKKEGSSDGVPRGSEDGSVGGTTAKSVFIVGTIVTALFGGKVAKKIAKGLLRIGKKVGKVIGSIKKKADQALGKIKHKPGMQGDITKRSVPYRPMNLDRKWRLGDPHDALVNGQEASRGTIRRRYWKNRAEDAANTGEFSAENLALMRRERSPIDSVTGDIIELEHIVPNRTGLPERHKDFLELTPLEHSFFDRFRRVKDPNGRSFNTSLYDDR